VLTEAQRLTGTTEKTTPVREARALIERESARRLARSPGGLGQR